MESATRLSIFFNLLVVGQMEILLGPLPLLPSLQRESTQVSFPHPWEEFTTREPFLRATRVKPPGFTYIPTIENVRP